MKQTWLIFLNGVFEASQYEETEEEALAAYRSCNFPPEEGDDLYPGDKPMRVTARRFADIREDMSRVQGQIARKLYESVGDRPLTLTHKGDRIENGGLVSTFSIEIKSGTNDSAGVGGISARDIVILSERLRPMRTTLGNVMGEKMSAIMTHAMIFGDETSQRAPTMPFDRLHFPILPEPKSELQQRFDKAHEALRGLSDAFRRFEQAIPRTGQMRDHVRRYMAIKMVEEHDHMTDVEVLKAKENKGPKPFRKWNAPRKMK
jgi:hypothetical protein